MWGRKYLRSLMFHGNFIYVTQISIIVIIIPSLIYANQPSGELHNWRLGFIISNPSAASIRNESHASPEKFLKVSYTENNVAVGVYSSHPAPSLNIASNVMFNEAGDGKMCLVSLNNC